MMPLPLTIRSVSLRRTVRQGLFINTQRTMFRVIMNTERFKASPLVELLVLK